MFSLLPLDTEAPDFTLPDPQGNRVRLQDFRAEKSVVLVFYPADNTLICTAQLCELRDTYPAFQEKGFEVLGLNPARPGTHAKFSQKHHFPFPILWDEGAKVASQYGAIWIPGLLTRRTVYGINTEGKICFAERGKPSIDKIKRGMSP